MGSDSWLGSLYLYLKPPSEPEFLSLPEGEHLFSSKLGQPAARSSGGGCCALWHPRCAGFFCPVICCGAGEFNGMKCARRNDPHGGIAVACRKTAVGRRGPAAGAIAVVLSAALSACVGPNFVPPVRCRLDPRPDPEAERNLTKPRRCKARPAEESPGRDTARFCRPRRLSGE